MMRFFTVLAALDTGSAFEGMGASREVQFSALRSPRSCWPWRRC
jgi:formate hydrogenlyase subunit 4